MASARKNGRMPLDAKMGLVPLGCVQYVARMYGNGCEDDSAVLDLPVVAQRPGSCILLARLCSGGERGTVESQHDAVVWQQWGTTGIAPTQGGFREVMSDDGRVDFIGLCHGKCGCPAGMQGVQGDVLIAAQQGYCPEQRSQGQHGHQRFCHRLPLTGSGGVGASVVREECKTGHGVVVRAAASTVG
mgnify:CR=1 FL=1